MKGSYSTVRQGGAAMDPQQKALKEGVHIVVGTPGRTVDLLRGRQLSFKQVRHFVLDEADYLLDAGYLSIYLSTYLCIYRYNYFPTCLSIYLPIYLPSYLSMG